MKTEQKNVRRRDLLARFYSECAHELIRNNKSGSNWHVEFFYLILSSPFLSLSLSLFLAIGY